MKTSTEALIVVRSDIEISSVFCAGNRGPNRIPVDWLTRVRIAIGAAKGLACLHTQGGPQFVHGNIKSSNILLNRDREACVADFGLSQLLGPSSTSATKVVGYRAPEVAVTRKMTQKTDVYSFGVVRSGSFLLNITLISSPFD